MGSRRIDAARVSCGSPDYGILVRDAVLFALAGACSRFIFRHVETRWQIGAFIAFAAGLQLVRAERGARRALIGFLILASASTLGLLAVMAHLEPYKLAVAKEILRNSAAHFSQQKAIVLP